MGPCRGEALRAACSSDSVDELKLRLASLQNQLAEQVHILPTFLA